MPTTVTKTVKPSGGDYTSLAQAVAGLKAQYANLVALDTILRIECYAMEDTAVVNISADWITDATRYIHIVAPAGERHRGAWTTRAYRLRRSAQHGLIRIFTTAVRLEGLQIENLYSDPTRTGGSAVVIASAGSLAYQVQVDSCIFRGCRGTGSFDSTSSRSIHAHFIGGSIRVRNCVIHGFDDGFHWNSMQAGAELVLYNNTFYGARRNNVRVTVSGAGVTLRLKNNLCVDAGTGPDFAITGTAPGTADYVRNLSSDGSAPGADAIRGARVRFRDVQAGDFRLDRDDTDAQDAGADLRQDAAWPFSADVAGERRTDAWSVGAVEYAPSRRDAAFGVRLKAAEVARHRPHPLHCNNGEERDYPYVANYSKGLQHDALGDVAPASYQSLLNALATRDPADFEAILLGPGGKKLTNPQAGLAFDLQGPDPQAVTMPPAPRIDTAQNSAEMGELYWMALARDVHFNDYGSSAVIQAAVASLNADFTDFRGPRVNGAVTTQTVFRGIFPGETVGPYLSQFLLKGTSDPRLPLGQGRSTADGLITYGELKINQRQVTVVPGVDYLTSFNDWLDVQNGWDRRGQDQVDTTMRRFVRNLRDLGERVHFDNVADHFFNACLILLHEVPGNQLTGSGVIARDMEFPFDQGNPYLAYVKQAPFATLGSAHALTLVWELLTRALRAVWFQKWFVHRRLRPEEFGGRIDNHLTGRRTYPQIDGEILAALQTGGLAPYYGGQSGDRFPSYLLPQAFPEGAPTHPAYGAGHATASGACATVLKAFFNESTPIENPLVPNADGTALVAYTGADAAQLTVGGEINKLAGNVALGRNAAGVHWRSDYDQSLLLGEQVAIGVLQEQSLLLNEPEFYQITRFDGTTIRIQNGAVTVV
ncbi:MAG: vanadium-dependent haloperoxidase [Gemmatimonadota bacterium]